MRPFLSRLSSALCRLWAWLFSSASLFAGDNFGCAQLPVTCKYNSTRLPLLVTKLAVVDDENFRSKDRIVAVRELQSNLANLSREKRAVLPQKQFDKPLTVPAMKGLYNWDHHFELPQQGQGLVFFTAECSNDVHVAISPQAQSMDPMYELVIGGWSNTASVARRRAQGTNLCTVPVGLNKPRLENDLWISIDKTTRLLRMGHGKEPSLESVFLIYKDLQFLSEARYVCFTTWDVPVTYSNVMVSAMGQ